MNQPTDIGAFNYTDPADLKVNKVPGPGELHEMVKGLESAVASLAERVARLEAWAQDHDPGPDPGPESSP
jgi:hypothetical protein